MQMLSVSKIKLLIKQMWYDLAAASIEAFVELIHMHQIVVIERHMLH